MAIRVLSNYEQAIQELKQLAEKQRQLGRRDARAALENEVEELNQWLTNGRRGPCPVDLEKHGLLITVTTSEPMMVSDKPVDNRAVEAESTLPAPMTETVQEEVEQAVEIQEAAPLVGTETPEQIALKKQLAQARDYFDQDEWRQSAALSRLIAEQAGGDVALKEAAEDLADRAQRKLNAELEKLLALGHAARAAGQMDEARRHYQAAQKLDTRSSDVGRALLELDQNLSEQLSRKQLAELRGGLLERKNLARLGDAVQEAEARRAEDTLTDELMALLSEARQAYDDLRRAHGEETTMMRFADLVGRKAARDKIANRVFEGEQYVLDAALNTQRPALEVLAEANQLYEQHSENTVQYELDRVRKSLPDHPASARQRLQEALQKPFYEQQQRMLEDKLQEVERLIADKDKAEAALAEQTDDPVRALGLALQARAIFPHLEGLAERIAQSRRTATETLAGRMAQHHSQANVLLSVREFQKAREQLAQADGLAALWPEGDKPEALRNLLATGQTLRQGVDARETLQHEFDQLAATIRQRTADPNHLQSGLDLFEQLRADTRFDHFPERATLTSEMDAFRSVAQQLAEARTEQTKGNWLRVRELAEKIQESGKAGETAGEVNRLLAEAVLEINIVKVQEYLRNDDAYNADKILSHLLGQEKNPQRKKALQERLSDEQASIDRCIKDNPPMQFLFKEAEGLADKRNAIERLQALRLYRYIGGDTTVKGDAEWPPYRPSMRTAEARASALRLASELRANLLPTLQQAFESRQTQLPEASVLRTMANRARLLREALLLESEDERMVARWLEVEQGRRHAQIREAQDDWDGAVAIWRDLHLIHPDAEWHEGDPPQRQTVESALRHARIWQAVTKAQTFQQQNQNERALAVLQEAREEPGLLRAGPLLLAIAEVYAQSGDITATRNALAGADHLDDAAREEVNMLAQANEATKNDNPKEALRILQTALGRSPTQHSPRLKQLRDTLFAENETGLLRQARDEQAKDADGKVRAVVALVNLREMEEILNRPEAERRSTAALNAVRDELETAAKQVVTEAAGFDPTRLPLDQALNKASELANSLQTFKSVAGLFRQELSDVHERLEKQRRRISDVNGQLKRLKETLNAAHQPALWEAALRRNDFKAIDQVLGQIDPDMSLMQEAQNFDQQLSEWKEMHIYLTGKITLIKNRFQAPEEDFDTVVQELRRLTLRPDMRANGKAWQQIQQKDYEAIREVMSNELKVEASDGIQKGWDEVKIAAAERAQELEAWQAWDRECRRLMEAAERAALAIESHQAQTTLTRKRQDWEALQAGALAAIEKLSAGARNGDQGVPIRSDKAHSLSNASKIRLEAAQTWLSRAQAELDRHEPIFPTLEEFNAAVAQKDPDRLERLLKRAHEVGASNAKEEQYITVFASSLQQMRKPPNRSWFSRK